MRRLPLLSLFAMILLLWPASADEKKAGLPQAEEKLFRFAVERMNRRQWREADRAFNAYLERFPAGAHAEDSLHSLGVLHYRYSRRYETARDWLNRFCEKYPQSKRYWPARRLVAQTFERQNLKIPAAEAYRALLEKCPDGSIRAQSAHSLLRLLDKRFSPYVGQTYTAGSYPEVRISVRNIAMAQLRLFRLPYDDVVEHLGFGRISLRDAVAKVPTQRRELVRKWSETFLRSLGNYHTAKVAVPAKEPGLYLLEAEHDKITMSVLVIVNRYGLVTKRASGRLLVYAQDRSSGAPVPEMKIRVFRKEKTSSGKTDEDGLYVADGVLDEAFVMGLKNGEYCFAPSQRSWYPDKQSRFHVVTDRPIYRPNQTVHFKVTHRVEEGERLDVQEGLRLKLTVGDPRGNTLQEEEVALNRFGSATGEFRLGDEPPLGTYWIRVEPRDATAPPARPNWGRFRVDEYRKPEYRVSVKFDRERYIQGDTLEATVSADYYFGSPVPNAQVTYTVYRRYRWSGWWRSRRAWHSWYADEDRPFGAYGRGERVHRGTGKTDAHGRLVFRHEIPRKDRDVQYTVVAQVVDLSRRSIEGQGGVVATQAEFALQLDMERSVAEPGKVLPVKIRAVTHDGAPLKDQAVALRVLQRRWRGKKYDEKEVFRTADLRTGKDGSVEVPLRVPAQGYMRLEAVAADGRGNTVKASRNVWIVSQTWDGAGYMRWRGVDVVPDKTTYEPGDTATFLLSSEVADAALLFTLEGVRLHHHQVVRLTGHTATVKVKLDTAMAPNVYAGVSALAKGKYYTRLKSIAVDPSHRFLTVTIEPDKEQYLPREKAAFKITTRDQQGRPVAAEVALGAVDDSIYALQSEYAQDIRQFFVHRRNNRVRTTASLQFWDSGTVRYDGGALGEAPDEAAGEAEGMSVTGGVARGRGAAKAKRSAFAPTEIRAEFADTMLWRPSVVTNAEGVATVQLEKTADNLTTWRLTARAMSRGGLVGQEQDTIVVRKDVIVRLETPRFFTQGDKGFVTAIVRNDLATAKDVTVRIEAEGIELDGDREKTVRIAAKGEHRIDWNAFVGAPGLARVTVKALTDQASDAMRLEVPVHPHGSLQWRSKAGLVERSVTETFSVPRGSIRESNELLIVVSPSHAAAVLDALDYLAGYPYGCVEQTMSRFLPTTITQRVLRTLQIRKPELEKELPAMIDQGLQRLYNFQHADGGWGWWKHDQSSPFTTAYVVYGLALARAADVAVSQNVLNRGIAALRRMQAQAEDAETRAYLLYALSVAGVKDRATRNALADGLADLPPPAKAMLALVLHKDGEVAEARRVLRALAAEAVEAGATARWKGAKHYHWTGHPVEATAMVLKAFLAADPDHPLVKKAVTWLVLAREGRHWVSTRQTAMVVFALADYLKLTGERAPDMTLTLDVNGERIYEKRVTQDNWYAFDGTVRLGPDQLREGENEIRLAREGTGTPVYAYYFRHFAKADSFEPSKGGLRLEREYSLVRRDEKGKRELVPLAAGARVESGDEIEVKLTVTADRVYRYLMIEDPLPAGCEPVRERMRPWRGRAWSYWYSNKEYRDEKVDIAVTYLPEGKRTVRYVMRAETPGAYRILPALVWNMYRPGEGGNSAGAALQVTDR